MFFPIGGFGSGGTPGGGGSGPTLVGAGTAAGGAGGVTVSWPTHTTGDLGIMVSTCRDNETLSTPSGWTSLGSWTSTSTKLQIFHKTAASASETDVTSSGTTNYNVHCIIVYRDWSAVSVIANDTAASSTSVTIPSGTTTAANAQVLGAVTNGTDDAAEQLSGGFTNATLSSVATAFSQNTGSGGGGGVAAFTATLASAGSTGTTTATLNTASDQARALLEIT